MEWYLPLWLQAVIVVAVLVLLFSDRIWHRWRNRARSGQGRITR